MNLADFLATYGAKVPTAQSAAPLASSPPRFGRARRAFDWREGADPYSEPPGGTEEVAYARIDGDHGEETWVVAKRGDLFFLLYQGEAEEALVWTENGWRTERTVTYRGHAREVRVTLPELFSSARAAQRVAMRVPSPRAVAARDYE
jgi:hypothetical protein